MHPTSHALASCFGLETVSHEVFGCKAERSPSSKALSDASVAFPLRRLMDTAVHSSYAHLQVGGTGTSARKSSVLHLIEENMCCILLYIVLLYHCHWSLPEHTRAMLSASRLTHALTHAGQTIGGGGVPGRAWKVNFSHLDKACQQSISKSTNSFRSICSLAAHKGH